MAHVMNLANRAGNTFDALLARVSGRCDSTDASWADLLSVSALFVVGAAAATLPVVLLMLAGRG